MTSTPTPARRRWSRPLIVLLVGVALPAVAFGTSGGLNRALRFGPGSVNHPVNVVPSRAIHVPDGWPLSPDGSIICTTCHETLPALNGHSEPHLRGKTDSTSAPAAFCSNCHTLSDVRTGSSLHWSAIDRAHITGDARPSIGGESMDRRSLECLSCHDGVSATERHGGAAWSQFGAGSLGGSGSHAVGVPYARKGLSRPAVALRPAISLPPEVRLPEGRVSCVSCHNLYERGKNHLTVPVENSALCFTCHAMD